MSTLQDPNTIENPNASNHFILNEFGNRAPTVLNEFTNRAPTELHTSRIMTYCTIPLSNAWTTCVGQNDSTELPHGVGQAVPLDGGADLLGAGGDIENALGLKFRSKSGLNWFK